MKTASWCRREAHSSVPRKAQRARLRRLTRWLGLVVATLVALSFLLVLPLRWFDPATSMVMLADDSGRDPLLFDWQRLEQISDAAMLAVVAAEDQRFADHVGIADRDDDGLVGNHRGELCPGRIATDLVGQFPHRLEGFGGGDHVGAQPPQRSGERMPFDDASTGHHETRRVEVQRAEGVSRFLDE